MTIKFSPSTTSLIGKSVAVNGVNAIAVGSAASIYYSGDSGQTWTQTVSDVGSNDFTSVFMYGTNAIAVGTNAGQFLQSSNSIAIGTNAGQYTQNNDCVAFIVLPTPT